MAQNNSVHLWLRKETKPLEHRTVLSPDVAKHLIEQGFKITVEKCNDRIFKIEDFEEAGCQIVETGTWRTAPLDTIIIGLKELPENDFTPLPHKHIMFAHCYKQQTGWKEVMTRFIEGKGTLYDLEFLLDDNNRRVAAYGFYAGFTGSAVGINSWCHQILSPNEKMPPIQPYSHEDILIAELKSKIAKVGRAPKILVIGALGRCGSGAVSLARKAGVPEENIIKWDMAETAKGGPFKEIIDADIFINCIYLTSKIPPFVNQDLINDPSRNLSVIIDVSCDPNSPNNPVPIYDTWSSFADPLLDIKTTTGKPLKLCAIDHLPSMLPRESSIMFCKDLLPSLLNLTNIETYPVWARAKKLFLEKSKEAQA
ncbi:Saccharopine dehydrogenase [NAD(+), L-lysine-forming] [Smittium culicis]|uniref:Saccharopine dehydrogenase [NAD(+), L-lysine-forming] n=2 Tax=Smittium culicis TaxID=133412 RepID=A0A1R1XEG3_9FUNG|nr:Saccharopine dehydrogenase [NAD(+), L-lysine-forming] [Smittium culicis]OMJ13846.1 Saccharopine dehydrogenase [NAD(+), L-lysine-forming] [Smittium culicis]